MEGNGRLGGWLRQEVSGYPKDGYLKEEGAYDLRTKRMDG